MEPLFISAEMNCIIKGTIVQSNGRYEKTLPWLFLERSSHTYWLIYSILYSYRYFEGTASWVHSLECVFVCVYMGGCSVETNLARVWAAPACMSV